MHTVSREHNRIHAQDVWLWSLCSYSVHCSWHGQVQALRHGRSPWPKPSAQLHSAPPMHPHPTKQMAELFPTHGLRCPSAHVQAVSSHSTQTSASPLRFSWHPTLNMQPALYKTYSSIQSLSQVRLFATPWTAAQDLQVDLWNLHLTKSNLPSLSTSERRFILFCL